MDEAQMRGFVPVCPDIRWQLSSPALMPPPEEQGNYSEVEVFFSAILPNDVEGLFERGFRVVAEGKSPEASRLSIVAVGHMKLVAESQVYLFQHRFSPRSRHVGREQVPRSLAVSAAIGPVVTRQFKHRP